MTDPEPIHHSPLDLPSHDPARQSGAPDLLRWSGLTDRGKVRANNEDSFLAMTFDAIGFHYLGKNGEGHLSTSDHIFAVSDGMGGAKAGEFASRIVVEKVTRLMPRSFRQGAIGIETGFADVLEE